MTTPLDDTPEVKEWKEAVDVAIPVIERAFHVVRMSNVLLELAGILAQLRDHLIDHEFTREEAIELVKSIETRTLGARK